MWVIMWVNGGEVLLFINTCINVTKWITASSCKTQQMCILNVFQFQMNSKGLWLDLADENLIYIKYIVHFHFVKAYAKNKNEMHEEEECKENADRCIIE